MSDGNTKVSALADCPLPKEQQTRNLILFAINVGMIYLGAPVLYVGLTQAALFDELKTDKTIANLPTTVYFLTTPLPILVAWVFPLVRQLKPVLVGSYLASAAAGALVVVTLLVPTPESLTPLLTSMAERLQQWFDLKIPPNWVILAINFHAAILGCSLGVVNTFQWEVLGRGVAISRRGQALTYAFGFGPILAATGSFASHLVLKGMNLPYLPPINSFPYPWNFAVLFGASVPIMALAAYLSTLFIIPQPTVEVERQPFISGVFGGLGEFFSYRLILLGAIALILVALGYTILGNFTLYTELATGEKPAQNVGLQNTLRFGFKAVVGIFLGWLLAKTNPKSGMLVTGSFCLASVLWVLFFPRELIYAFALMGAGELMGLYFPNYIFYCSAKSRMRRNMAFTNMLNVFTSFGPVMFGRITDQFGKVYGEKVGFQISFGVAIALIVASLLMVVFVLSPHPRPRESDMDASDKALIQNEGEPAKIG